MDKIRAYINKPFIIAIAIILVTVIIVGIYSISGHKIAKEQDPSYILVLNSTESSGDTSSQTEEPETSSGDLETSSEEITSDEATTDTSAPKPTPKPTSPVQYTTKPIQQITTTHDNSGKNEVMGGGSKYESPDDEDVEPTPPVIPTPKPPVETAPPEQTTAPPESSTEDTTAEENTTSQEAGTGNPDNPATDNTENTTSDNETSSAGEENTEPVEEVTQSPEPIKHSEHAIKKPSDFILDVTYGIDVSKWQETINWKEVKNYGVDFAMIKLGGRTIDDGTIYMDTTFKYNIENALLNNIKVGIYFFSQAISVEEAIEEASYVIANLEGYNITYPICFDFEQGNQSSNPVRRTYLAMQNGTLTREVLTEMACAFCNTVEAAGYESAVYASRSSWRSARWDGAFLNDTYRTWLAVYYSAESGMLPNFGTGNNKTGSFKDKYFYYFPTFTINNKQGAFQMWQYYDRGRVSGIKGNVDLDMCFYIHEKYPGYVCPLKVTLKNTVFNTGVGKKPDIMSGVKATNVVLDTRPLNEIKVKITNALGAEFSLEDAVKNTGSYTIEYSLTDFTGCTRCSYAALNVSDS